MENWKAVNRCVRCGKPRIVVSVEERYEFQSLLTITQMSCPDPECQKILELQWEKQRLAKEAKMGTSKSRRGRKSGK